MRTMGIVRRCISLCLVVMLHVGVVTAQNTSPLCFTARNESVTVRFEIKNAYHTIEYSTNGSYWSTYTSNTDVTIAANQSIYFRAAINLPSAIAFGNLYDYLSSRFFFSCSFGGGNVEASGNIMSLYGPDCPDLPLPAYAFAYMFSGCTILTTPPELPATTLASSCYCRMFNGCSWLITAPALPATTLATACYHSMFYGCSSLTTPPAMSATTLADYCYQDMFFACTSLTTPPELPATTLTNNCYYQMFNHCPSIRVNTSSPGKQWKIPATSAANNAVTDMFAYTGGILQGTPSINTYYYIASAPQYNITVNVNDPTQGTVSGGGIYYIEDSVALTANAHAHYYFVYWSDGNISNPRSIVVSGDTAFTAVFAIDKHTITGSGTNGTVTGGGTYDYGSNVTLTATANQHYHFARWSDGNTQNPRTVTVSGNATYTAVFEGDSHNITASGTNGSVIGGGTHNYGTTATLTAVADDHYHFVRWSDGNTQNPRTVTVSGNATYTAVFEIDKHTVAVAGDNGSYTGGGTYDYGTTVTLTVTPDEHFYFSRWSDGNTDNPRNVVVTADTTYTAIMEGKFHSVTATCEHGEVTGNGSYHYADIATLAVIADDGYRFVEWSDGNEYNPRVFVVEGDLEVEAICEVVAGVEDIEESVAFYYVDGRVVNPEGMLLRVYSTEGKMVKSGDGDIMIEGLPKGMYMVVDERGRTHKFVI